VLLELQELDQLALDLRRELPVWQALQGLGQLVQVHLLSRVLLERHQESFVKHLSFVYADPLELGQLVQLDQPVRLGLLGLELE